jgi:hypothetical protein
VEPAGVARLAGFKTGYDLIAHFEGLAGEIGRHVLAERDDFTSAFMTELDRAEAEGIAFVFVDVSSANAAAFDFHEYFIVSDLRHVNFMNHHFTGFFKNRNSAFCGN